MYCAKVKRQVVIARLMEQGSITNVGCKETSSTMKLRRRTLAGNERAIFLVKA